MSDKLKSLLAPKRKFAAVLSISFTSGFMLFIYTPLDIYLHNPSDFVVSWRFFLLPLLITFVLLSLAIVVVLFLTWHRKVIAGVALLVLCSVFFIIARFEIMPLSYILAAIAVLIILWVSLLKVLKEKALDVVLLLMWGLLVAAYVQTLFLNNNMVEIMGQQNEYSELLPANILNLLIWLVIILTPLCIWIIFKKKKKEFKYEIALTLSMVVILGMQAVGLVSTAASTDLPEGFEKNPVCFSYDAAVSFNPNENIIVFILDMFDVGIMRNTLELYPNLWEYFDGFTYYENNTTEFLNTVTSLVSMLTGHHAVPWQEGWPYIEEAWARHTLIDTLREHDFRVNLYLDRHCTFNRYELIEGRVDNIIVADGLGMNLRPFLALTTRLSLGRISPYLLKNTWLAPITPDFGKEFFNIIVENEASIFVPVVGVESDMRFLRFIRQSEFTADSEESVFLFMHFNAAHADGDKNDPTSVGFHYDEETSELRYGGSQADITRALFEGFNYYFNRMKELGVYDNSTIIITADHGIRSRVPETTALLIKPKGSTGALELDTVTELSHKYFQASILDAAGLPREESEISHFDIINGLVPAPPKRIVYVPGVNASAEFARIYGDYGVWEIVGDANVRENWTFVPMDPMDFFP